MPGLAPGLGTKVFTKLFEDISDCLARPGEEDVVEFPQ